MPGGLVALLDDIAALAKLASASLDDVAAAAGTAGSKAAGVVIDDAAVTPAYVTGLSPDRELPIIAKITVGSLRNKLVLLLPAALLLSYFAPWAITPILMLGGAYLSFEGVEKIYAKLRGHDNSHEVAEIMDAKALEDRQVSGAIRTDLILSAEIMAIALAAIPPMTIGMRAIVLALVAIGITLGVYGAVALIVKMDDIGLNMATRKMPATRAVGRWLVRAMPQVLSGLSIIGTAAMLWVGGGIIVHGLEVFHLDFVPNLVHGMAIAAGAAMPAIGGAVAWIVSAAIDAVVAMIVGAVVMAGVGLLPRKAAH